MKLNIKLEDNWLEATWLEDETQIHCESFSGHKEHITMLRTKAKEFNTSLKEFESLIKKCQDVFIYPSDEEIAKEELQHKLNEAQYLLDSTQFKFGEDYDKKKNTPEWEELKVKRAEAREFIRGNK